MPATRPKVRDELTVVELDGEAVVYDESTSRIHQLNPTATIIFKLCDGTSTVREMAEDISSAFAVGAAEVQQQIRVLIRDFRRRGFLSAPSPGGFPRPPTPPDVGKIRTPMDTRRKPSP